MKMSLSPHERDIYHVVVRKQAQRGQHVHSTDSSVCALASKTYFLPLTLLPCH